MYPIFFPNICEAAENGTEKRLTKVTTANVSVSRFAQTRMDFRFLNQMQASFFNSRIPLIIFLFVNDLNLDNGDFRDVTRAPVAEI